MLHIAQGNMQEGERGGGREMHSGEKSINGFLLGRRPFQEAQRREREREWLAVPSLPVDKRLLPLLSFLPWADEMKYRKQRWGRRRIIR